VGDEGSPDWTESRTKLEDKVETATSKALRDLQLKDQLGLLFSRRSKLIWGFIFSAIIASLSGVILMMLDLAPWNAVSFGGAAICLALGAVVGARSVKTTRAFYMTTIEKHRKKVAEVQRAAFSEGTADFYHDFVALFEPLRSVCREHREKYEPQLRIITTAEKTLAELEHILAPVEKALNSRK
jgi:hypothetical protein